MSAEPPSHPVCARRAASVCPFLSNPAYRRTDGRYPGDRGANPGVYALWLTIDYELAADGRLIVGAPRHVMWISRGQPADRGCVLAALDLYRDRLDPADLSALTPWLPPT